jgi:8-amino-7-oxononanoate synthase
MTIITHEPLSWIDAELDDLEQAGLRRRLAERSSPQTAEVVLDGRRYVNFGSNDYLGLAADPRLAAAATAAIERHGWGSSSSPLVSGRATSHAALERRLAEFQGTEAALVFPSGFAANAGVIPALVDEGDAVFSDAMNHASLIDGCRLSKAARIVYPHCDPDALEVLLRDADRFRRRLIVSNSLFSMTGELAPLAELAELAERYDAMLMVDEAHAVGVFGQHGRGVVEYLGTPALRMSRSIASRVVLDPGRGGGPPGSQGSFAMQPSIGTDPFRVHIRVGALSKALGSGGGFVCGSQSLVDWLANRVRSYIFSTAQPAATSAAALAALDIVEQEPERRAQLLARAAELRARFQSLGWSTGRSESQIIPLVVGEPQETMRLAAGLREAGFFVPGIRPPSVPPGESLLRLTLCYHHTPAMVDGLIDALARLRQRPRFSD